MRFRTFLRAALIILAPAPAMAGALRVDPVQLTMPEEQRAVVVTLTNMGDAPLTFHAYGMRWNQQGHDQYSETTEVIVSPPIATIPAQSTQLVRVGFRHPATSGGAWRLVVEEVPEQPPEGGVQVALRMNLPLLAGIEEGKTADLTWSASASQGGDWILEATNTSDRYVRIDAASFTAATGIQHSSSIRLGTVLPHARLSWRLPDVVAPANTEQFRRIKRTSGSHDGLAVISSRN